MLALNLLGATKQNDLQFHVICIEDFKNMPSTWLWHCFNLNYLPCMWDCFAKLWLHPFRSNLSGCRNAVDSTVEKTNNRQVKGRHYQILSQSVPPPPPPIGDAALDIWKPCALEWRTNRPRLWVHSDNLQTNTKMSEKSACFYIAVLRNFIDPLEAKVNCRWILFRVLWTNDQKTFYGHFARQGTRFC